MKKFFALFLILVMSISMVGCVPEERNVRHTDKPEYNEIEVADSKSEEGNGKDTVREDGTGIKDSALEDQDKNRKEKFEKSKEPEKELDPKFEHIYEIYEKYRDVLAEGDHLFTISDKISKESMTSLYYLSIYNKKGEEAKLEFYVDEKENISKSFSVSFFDTFDNKEIEDFISVTFLALDTEISEEDSVKKKKDIMKSYVDIRSKAFYAGEYGIVIEKHRFLAESIAIYIMHNSEVNPEVNSEEYKIFSAEEMVDLKNKGKKACLVATPSTYTLSINNLYSSSLLGTIEFKAVDKEGNVYYLYYTYSTLLIDFELGKTYTFYGIIVHDWDGIPHLRIEHYEE